MRTTSTIFSLLIGLSITSASMTAAAQGRGRDRGNDHDHHNHDRHSNRRDHDRRDRHDDRHYVRYEARHIHYHDRYCGHRPVAVHQHYQRPRYIYYRDYDVYYDVQRSVYISYSGRGWTVATAVPVTMRHVNVRTARSYEVDYYDDDMPRYLERSRPACGREYNGW